MRSKRPYRLLALIVAPAGVALCLLWATWPERTPGRPRRSVLTTTSSSARDDRAPGAAQPASAVDVGSLRGSAVDPLEPPAAAGVSASAAEPAIASTEGVRDEGPEDWEPQYADVSWQAMLAESRELKEALFTETRSELQQRARIGGYEVIGVPRPAEPGGERQPGGIPPGAFDLGAAGVGVRRGLDSLTFTSTELRKVSLPEWQYPEQHAIYAKADWLERTASERRAREAEGHVAPGGPR